MRIQNGKRMELTIQGIDDRFEQKRLRAVRDHAARVSAVGAPAQHLAWLSQAAHKHDVPGEALRAVYLTERYYRRAAWRLIEWTIVWIGWVLGLSRHLRSFDLTVGLCQVRVSSWLAVKGQSSAQAPDWQDLRELMGQRQNIFACASVLGRELGISSSATWSARSLAESLRRNHFGYSATFPGDCVGLGNLLEELICLQRERENETGRAAEHRPWGHCGAGP